jgi:hypothetical protein
MFASPDPSPFKKTAAKLIARLTRWCVNYIRGTVPWLADEVAGHSPVISPLGTSGALWM